MRKISQVLKALGLQHQEFVYIARVSGNSVTRYLKTYAEGGLAALCSSQLYCTDSALLRHREVFKTHVQSHQPHTVAQASHDIEKLTGIKLSLSAYRDFMCKLLGYEVPKNGGDPVES